MQLQTGNFYWPTTFSEHPSYPPLNEDITCDVVIIGGGSSGAQCAHYLSETGLDVVIVDKRKVGEGSTLTNTALIQYLGDKMLFELVNSFGEKTAIAHTKLCEAAINDIENAAHSLDIPSDFIRRDSLYFASYKEDIEKLEKEYFYLNKHGFQATLLEEREIKEKYGFSKYKALYTFNDGEINPFRFNHALIADAVKKGVRMYEHTRINGKKLTKDAAICSTENGYSITAKKVIFAAGYENLEFKKEKNGLLLSSYAVVTNQLTDFSHWHKRTLIWETARPYIYMRTTKDNRIIIGGLDDDTTNPEDRDSKIIYRKNKLIKECQRLFPELDIYPEYYLGAFYGGTHDGLPIIGEYEEYPNCYFLMAYGDNGLVYSMALAKILKEVIVAGSHPAMSIYSNSRRKTS
ncbi:FAD-binding oxidoreductase [Niallia sp. NCCP-28]|uniref:NAD(P)/FAD-dependent oxidoreductase n=1 Tax=Niallia sp. NCCP-28 TaxID=2934712 RepID=UPI0020818C1E|nr:FAD-dependent oxidoreductase [Niallia sp. NCCP-28]GKU83785.1 oxidoreductase [Niallia sp. NCCP-28]